MFDVDRAEVVAAAGTLACGDRPSPPKTASMIRAAITMVTNISAVIGSAKSVA
ncbi:MAG: hypothetical protein WBP81_31640 [Solirubrobacteraceae bacterium]